MQIPHFIRDLSILRYGMVGVVGTIIDVGLLYLLVEFAHFPILSAATLSFCAAVANNFFMNKYWTFKNREKKSLRQSLKFLATALVGLALNNLILSLLIFVFHIWYVFAKLITSGIVFFWNFSANKFWTFASYVIARPELPAGLTPTHDISIVIPALNEEENIARMFDEIKRFFSQRQNLSYEVIVVDDGSTDSTQQIVNEYIKANPHITLIPLEKNFGKGYAVQQGVLKSRGNIVLFTDTDGSTPLQEFEKLLSSFSPDTHIVIGSRYLPASSIVRKQPWYRIALGRVGNKLIQLVLLSGIVDTQCGFKAFSFEAAHRIFPKQKIHRWGFDMEILTLGRHMNYHIQEIPVSWHDMSKSRLRPIRDAHRTLRDLCIIKWNLLTKKY